VPPRAAGAAAASVRKSGEPSEP
jgi:hypothetical protein